MGEPQNVKWLFAGDANETPSESIILESLQPLGGTYRGIGSSTRWEGNRELDWGVTNVHDVPCPTKEMHHFADHFPITFTIPIWDQDLSLQYLAFGPTWKKPSNVNRDDWAACVSDSWATVQQDCERFLQNLVPDIDVDAEWVQFMQMLNSLFRSAFARLAATTLDEETRKCCRLRLKQKGLKGIDLAPPVKKRQE